MIIFCKHCGAALRVDDARLPSTTFRVRCHHCKNLLTVEPPKAGASGAASSPGNVAARGPAAPAPTPYSSGRPADSMSTIMGMRRPDLSNLATPPTGSSPAATAETQSVITAPRPVAPQPPPPSAPAPDNGPGAAMAGVGMRGSVTDTTAPGIAPIPQAPPPPPAVPRPRLEPIGEPPRPAPAPSTAGRSHFLQKIPLFASLNYDGCQMVESLMRNREFPPFQTIVKEGGPGDSMYVINAGAVEVRKKDVHTGIDFLISELRAGACFGEMALLTGKPRTATVVSTEPTICGVLEKAAFEKLMLANPRIGMALSKVLAERLEESIQATGIEYINLAKLQFDARVVNLLPQPLIWQHKVIPVAFANNRLSLAMVNPNNLVALDDVRRIVKGVIIEPVVTSEEDFRRFMSVTFPELLKKEEDRKATQSKQGQDVTLADTPEAVLESLQSEALASLEVDETQQVKESVTDLSKSAEEGPIVKLANNLLALAIKKGASDIHLEPQEKDVSVRFRIDGALQQVQVLPKKIQMGLISRFKILSRLDIAEKRLPQDGRISVRLEERPIDFRVSTIPSKWGEKICMRILDKSNTTLGLDKLILHEEVLGLVREMISQPYGIIYVTGPTGSGKTTTLYSGLAELNDPDVNISTAEDPIEYDLPRVNQVQAHKDIGLDFARILRAFLRQDPDIILVGETRDKETAHIAVEAALTGHLVFTTLHTNDAAGAFTRLGEMGVE
ncbi:MAG: ATPase, T2SS/T4P/T4SS family, partial [Deltaproteobacteria bacterium]